ncbi:transcription termination factor NusA [Tuwongella immobilis]|uniref:Transcription termination/antitermination protein NusA n=1 Tax=Tuwongella immobilis TaxID=692036 RepID=A0A6C2YJE1_9BACT|nr:transcription termination factor NusA [Tuwongella immobilis]VIP01225.1 transcription termination factor : NusA antitermination factor OS=Planctomyces brasiliensis (strain ATCC 49424 / DSM 5305 / JCM 21570 / NBRC 103401 / IFAM 1448) GN=Plabr_3541 PE=3 SV=1: NusA_N: NusA_N: S1: KH_5 [Tuwongella immobilis]VTR97876.1 transcription termination factor : NusA antitermination factor OS=Planctomyces brasiliensis (strain ATCC 49424 / DSM 5305 / JCM 21570 / NBRC 103401 / IFAM 1448) GN=Plabr_3541 PE=3 SV=
MNSSELLRLVNQMHQEKNIPKEVIFSGIEAAIQVAAERATGNQNDVVVEIDRITGEMRATKGGNKIDPELLGRIAAQSAKQLIIQKIREAEGDTVFNEYQRLKGKLVSGLVQRVDSGTAIVSLGKAEAILPRSEQIPGETHHVNDRVKAVVIEVKRNGPRVKIVLSRNHPDFVRSLFEQDIPEIQDHTIEIKAVAREPGHRSKIAVSSIDMKVDCVGACVGVRGSRIKNIIEELNNERIDIVRWNDSLQVLIPNALQPAQITEVFTYPRLGRAIVLVTDDQLSLAIGRRGQNVRLASKLIGWDIEIMTHEELGETLEKAERWFRHLPGISEDGVQTLIEEGFLSYTDVTFLEPAQLGELVGVDEEAADEMILFAEEMSETIEKEGDPFAPQENAENLESAETGEMESVETDGVAAESTEEEASEAVAEDASESEMPQTDGELPPEASENSQSDGTGEPESASLHPEDAVESEEPALAESSEEANESTPTESDSQTEPTTTQS